MKDRKETLEALVFGILTIGFSYFVFWGPIAIFRVPTISFVSATKGPIWAIILFLIGGFVPSLVALLLTRLYEGKEGLKVLLKRAFEFKIGVKWYLVIVSLALAGAIGQILLNSILGNKFPFDLYIKQLPSLLPLLITGPISEEFGWRGYFLRKLQKSYTALFSSLIVGITWAFWHLPLFLMVGTSQYELKFPFIGFLVGIIAQSIIMTWIDSNTESSIFAAIFYHWIFTYVAQVNSTGVIRSIAYNWLEYTPYIFIAIVNVIAYGKRVLEKKI
jgi:membrane protease YdiL (CAAX protease family)